MIPDHGGEILDLVHLATGRQLLGRPPFASEPPRPGDLEEPAWTASYRGGWQLAAPNAGNLCEVDGVQHGFHGRASNDPLDGGARRPGRPRPSRGRATGFGSSDGSSWRATRSSSTTRFLAQAVAGLVAVEHLSVGLELLEPEVEIRLPGGTAYELSEAGRAAHRPGRCAVLAGGASCSTAPASARTAGVCRSHGAATWSSATSRQERRP